MILTVQNNPYLFNYKPRSYAKINTSHPFCVGLKGFYLFNEGNGNSAVDFIQNNNMVASGFGSNNPWQVLSQLGISLNTNLAGFYGNLSSNYKFKWPITLMGAIRRTGSPSAVSLTRLFGLASSVSTDTPFDVFNIGYSNSVGSGTTLTYNANNNGTGISATTTNYTVPLNSDIVICITIDASGNVTLYVNGIQVFFNATGYSNPTFSNSYSAITGTSPGLTGTRLANTTVYWWGWWNRIFSSYDISIIGSSIYNIFQIFNPIINTTSLYQNRIISSFPSYYNILLGNKQLNLGKPSLLRR